MLEEAGDRNESRQPSNDVVDIFFCEGPGDAQRGEPQLTRAECNEHTRNFQKASRRGAVSGDCGLGTSRA